MSEFRIETVSTDNVEQVPELLYRGFGYSYTDSWMYKGEKILEASESGRYLFLLALDRAGRARAIVALRFPYPNRTVGELGTLLTDPETRGVKTGAALKGLINAIRERTRHMAEAGNLRALVSTELTLHQATQRLVHQAGFVTTGIYLGWTPAWAEHQRIQQIDSISPHRKRAVYEQDFRKRRTESVSVLAFWQLFRPYAVHLPGRFRPLLEEIYERLQLPVSIVNPLPNDKSTSVKSHMDFTRSLARIEVLEVGDDAPEVLREQLQHYRNGLVDLIHFILPLAKGDIDPSIEALMSEGCVFGSLIPCYRDCDVVVLQYLNKVTVQFEESQLFSDLAKRVYRSLR